MSLKKKIVLIIVSILFIGAIVFLLLIKYSIEHILDGNVSTSREIIKSDLGDEFLIEYETRQFPRISTGITIKTPDGEKQLEYFVIHDNQFQKQNIQTILNTSDIRCYLLYEVLLYRVREEYGAIHIDNIESIDLDIGIYSNRKILFNQVAKALVDTKDWRWIKICAEFLIKEGDEDLSRTLNRYAFGQFTSEELEINKNNEVTKEEIMDFSLRFIR